MTVDTRDPVGSRILQQTQGVNSTAPLVENMTWRGNSTHNSYTATRTGTGALGTNRALILTILEASSSAKDFMR